MPIIKSEYIRRKLSYIKSMVEDDNKQQLYNINTIAEYIFMQILNDVYGWNLQNENDEVINFPAIDLMDTTNEIVIQVTSDTKKKKVKEDTVEAFNKLVKEDKYKSYAHYEIKMFYIKDKPSKNTLKNWEEEGLISQSNILGIEDINKKVSGNSDIADKVYSRLKKMFDSDIFNQINNYINQVNLTKSELEAQRVKEKKPVFSTTPKSKQVYINREIDNLLSNKIAQKKGCVLFLHGQGGIGKSTLLEKFSNKTDDRRPTIFIQINEQVEMSMVSIFLDENKTTARDCPKFEAKLNEIFIEQKNDKEIPFNAEFELLEAIREDFGEHGVFIVDIFEKNKNSRIRSSVKFDNNTVCFSRTESHQRFRDYLNSLVHLFVSHTTFIIAGRNRINDVNESRSDEKFLNIDNVEELEMKKFSSSDIEQYIQEHKLESPTQKQLTDIENVTHGNPLILSLLVKVASEYDGWDELNYDEMKEIVYEDREFGLIYYFTTRIATHASIEDIWKLVIPRILSQEIEFLLFPKGLVFQNLVDVGLLEREKGKRRKLYKIHDDVAISIKSYAKKELTERGLSWYDNLKVAKVHRDLMEFYSSCGELKEVNSVFEQCYHKIMLRKNFEKDFEVTREEFASFTLGSLFFGLKNKLALCQNWEETEKSEIVNLIERLKNEKDFTTMSSELYQVFSTVFALGKIETIYDIEYLKELTQKEFSNDDFVFYIMGNAYGNLEEYRKAIEAYTDSIKINSKNDKAYNNIGMAYRNLKEYEKAIEAYEKSIEINPQKEDAYYSMGSIYYKLKKYGKAIEVYKRWIEINSQNDGIYSLMGIVYYQLKEYKQAIEVYKKSIEINSQNYEIYSLMGIAYTDLKEYKKAIEACKKSIEINPQYDKAYYNMGIAYDNLQEYEKAIEVYKKSIDINPQRYESYYNMGLNYEKQKELKKMIKSWKKVFELNPKRLNWIQKFLLWMYRKIG